MAYLPSLIIGRKTIRVYCYIIGSLIVLFLIIKKEITMNPEDYLGTAAYKKVIKNFTDKIKFNCDFIDNVCVNVRESKIPSGECSKSIPCCCGHCFEGGGFLPIPRRSSLWKENYEKLFFEDIGFYRKNSGCILSREYRSKICNGFLCSTLLSKMSRVEKDTYYKEKMKLYDYWRT